MTKHHYVYKSFEEEGREYIGVRSCNCLPEEDTKYFGSFRDKTFKPIGKTILFVCETRKEVAEIEIELHDFFDVAVNPQFANKAKQTSTGFSRAGVPNSEEQKKKISVANTGRTHTEAQKKANSERNSGEKHPQYGKTGEKNHMFGVALTEETRRKMSEAISGEKNRYYGKFGAAHNCSKAIIAIEPDGTQRHYGGVREATRDLRIPHSSLCRYLKLGKQQKKGKWKGWQFIYENP